MPRRWEDERYVRVYTRDSPDWIVLPWPTRCLFWELLRHADRAGLISLGRHGATGLAALMRVPLEVVAPALKDWLAEGSVRYVGQGEEALFIPNFYAAQEAIASNRARQKAKRERAVARAKAGQLGLGFEVVDDTERDEDDTGRVEDDTPRVVPDTRGSSRDTPSVPSRAVPSVPSRTVPKKKQRSGEVPPEIQAVHDRVLARMNAIRGTPGKGFGNSIDLIARIRAGVSEADLLAVVEAQGRREWMQANGWRYFVPPTLFGPKKFAGYLDLARAAPAVAPAFSTGNPIEDEEDAQWRAAAAAHLERKDRELRERLARGG
jgi:uncharacterized phage protein (TIGR02220 family)